MARLNTEKIPQWKRQMAGLHKSFRQHHDTENTIRLEEWYKKSVIDNKIVLAFCGHFSAGKSSLLNEILGDQFLPSSPIPTSGNLVRIQSGRPAIVLETRAGETVAVPEHYPIEKLQSLLRDSETIHSIDVQLNNALPPGVVLLDTPGVDSTDERHQQATEQALHLADAVFYVTDYNHVLSTVNFHFLKKLEELGKPYYLLINQIDKHDDREGSISAFVARVENALNEWQLRPRKLFCLSLRDKTVPGNAIKGFLAYLKKMMAEFPVSATQDSRISQGLAALVAGHRAFLKNRFMQLLQANHLDAAPEEAVLSGSQGAIDHLETEIAGWEEQARVWLEQAERSLAQTVQSAILTPYVVREAAQAYLASLDPQFKIGWFAGRKKIEKEQERRLNNFLELYQKQEQTMEWAVKDALDRLYRAAGHEAIAIFSGVTLEELKKIINESVSGTVENNGAFLLHYADRIAEQTKQQIKAKARVNLRELNTWLDERRQGRLIQLRKQLAKEKQRYQLLAKVRNEKALLDTALQQMEQLLADPNRVAATDLALLAAAVREKETRIQHLTIETFRQKYRVGKTNVDTEAQTTEFVVPILETSRTSEVPWQELLRRAGVILQPIDGFKNAADALRQTASRLEQKTFTIALFGAFSAGKSSFANALLGEELLPVSANPTTAVINRIQRSENSHPHGTAVVQMKREQDLCAEINQVLYLFDEKIAQLDELQTLLPRLKAAHPEPARIPQLTYLQTLASAVKAFDKEWGSLDELSIAASKERIADERVACLIDNVTMYYDCPFTRQGAVLVDTPGSSSIHARHTEVAFQWIKNADAILFLTYFNHAFARADREFLIQLGRVKGTFSIDKMFFIINAIDLAQNAQEKQDVMRYVQNQLLRFGVRQPKLYGVSSKRALQEQKNGGTLTADSGLKSFLDDWQDFAESKLLRQVAVSGLSVIQQTTDQIGRLLDDLQLNGAAKKQRMELLIQQRNTISEAISALPLTKRMQDISQQSDELFFYIKKRLMQRAHDEFSQFFNPANFFEKDRSTKEILYQSLKEWLDFLSFDLDQECRATFLRIEALMGKLHLEIHERCITICAKEGLGISLSIEQASFASPLVHNHLKEKNISTLTTVFKFYKNSKQFFEKDGAQLMREALEDLLEPLVSEVLERNRADCVADYLKQFDETATRLKQAFQEQVSQAADRTLQMLQVEPQSARSLLTEAHHQLTKLYTE